MGTEDNSDRSGRTLREMGWKPARKNYFPPPKDLPDYATRPLPPRPSSSSSSIYDSDPSSSPPKQYHAYKGGQEDSRFSTNFSGLVDESALRMVRPPSIVTDLRRPQEQDEIASPQPRYPEHGILKIKTDEDPDVSPLLTPPSGKNTHYHYTVSPLSPLSMNGFDTAVLGVGHPSSGRPNSWQKEKNEAGAGEQQPSQTDSLQVRLQKINLRHSDPGSPMNRTMDASNFGEPGPDVGGLTRFNQGHSAAYSSQQSGQPQYDSRGYNTAERDTAGAGEERKVAFKGANIDSYSHRTAASSQRPGPAPLKLSERPLAETYVKTPFPPRTNSDYSQRSVFEEEDDDDDDVEKKHNRLSSGISGFTKSHRPSSHKGDSSGSVQHEARKADEPSRASPGPMMRNMISKAKSGLKMGSDESKKERKRESLKKQIKVEAMEE